MSRPGFTCCWACDFRWENAGPAQRIHALLYEHVVEIVEERERQGFTISDIWTLACARPVRSVPGLDDESPATWHRWADGPSLYPLVGQVLRDLAEHGLITCTRKAVGQRVRCLRWHLASS